MSSPKPARVCSTSCFRIAPVTRHDAAHIHDHLDLGIRPTVVLMNPPFSAAAHVEGRVADAALAAHLVGARAPCRRRTPRRHHRRRPVSRQSRLARRLRAAPGARPRRVLGRHRRPRLCASRHHHRHQADRHRPRARRRSRSIFPSSPGIATDPAVLLDWITQLVPPRASVATTQPHAARRVQPCAHFRRGPQFRALGRAAAPVPTEAVELGYEPCDWMHGRRRPHHRRAL